MKCLWKDPTLVLVKTTNKYLGSCIKNRRIRSISFVYFVYSGDACTSLPQVPINLLRSSFVHTLVPSDRQMEKLNYKVAHIYFSMRKSVPRKLGIKLIRN